MSCRLLVRSVLVSVVWTASLPSDMRRVEYAIPCTRAMIQLKTGCSLRILMKADGMLGAIKATSTWSSRNTWLTKTFVTAMKAMTVCLNAHLPPKSFPPRCSAKRRGSEEQSLEVLRRGRRCPWHAPESKRYGREVPFTSCSLQAESFADCCFLLGSKNNTSRYVKRCLRVAAPHVPLYSCNAVL